MRTRLLITTILSLLLGAVAGSWFSPAAAGRREENRTKARAEADVAEREPLAPAFNFTNARTAHEWMDERVHSGRGAEVEALFRPESGLTEALRVELARGLVAHNYRRMDPHVLGRVLSRLPENKTTIMAWNDLVTRWCSDDAEECLRFLETLPSERLNAHFLHNASFGLSQLPAERLLAFARRLNDRGRAYLAEGLASFADQSGSWANTSAVLSQLDVKADEKAIPMERQLATNLARIAPAVIEAGIAAETDARKRDHWLEGYAWVIGREDPAAGLQIDARIANAELRKEHHQHHLSRWLKSDRVAALSWLLSDSARAQMSEQQRRTFLASYGLEAAP